MLSELKVSEVLVELRCRADLRKHAALRRVGIDVIEMLESRPDI